MASRIQGITVEIGGDTTKLSKALESVNKSIKGTQSGLKDVNKLLKLDPSSTELVVQNQKMLKDAIEATKEKLASPFSCLNNFYFKILSSFLGSLHFAEPDVFNFNGALGNDSFRVIALVSAAYSVGGSNSKVVQQRLLSSVSRLQIFFRSKLFASSFASRKRASISLMKLA